MGFYNNNLKFYLEKIDEISILSLEENFSLIKSEINHKIVDEFSKNNLLTNHSQKYIDSLLSNHLYFMKEAFYFKDEKIFYEHLLWEISTYTKMGIPFDFFKYLIFESLEIFKDIDEKRLNPMIKFYEYLLQNYDDIHEDVNSYKMQETIPFEKEIYNEFMNALLKPSLNEAIEISNKYIKNSTDLKIFWENILLSALYSIGAKWSNGEISVGQEHTATSICQRVMSIHYEKILQNSEINKKAAVIVSPNELHEIGARMISDLLESHGFETFFFGSRSSVDEIVDTIIEEDIKDILISTTIISNISATKELISQLRKRLENKEIKIYIGGQAYKDNKSIVEDVNADIYVTCFDSLIDMLKEKT